MINKIKANPKPVVQGGIIGIIAAAVIGVASLTNSSEGRFHKAYLDPVKIPTICEGHTKGVKLGDTATDAQCDEYYRQDMTSHMSDIVKMTPELTEYPNGLQAAGDFAFNTGVGAWRNSPMAKYAKQRSWPAMCEAFKSYYTGATYPRLQPKLKCKPKISQPGKYVCELPGLVKRRLNESKMCYTGSFK